MLLQVAFQDMFPYLLMSEASVEDLNTRLEKPVTLNNFRPNIVVSECEPYAEVKVFHRPIQISQMQLKYEFKTLQIASNYKIWWDTIYY